MNSKAEKEIHESLNSCNDTKITDAIQKIIKKDFFVFIPKLATLYVTTQNEDIKRIIADSFYCLKKPDSILHIISVISDKSLVKDNKMLIASCWNTGLDYAPHLEFFTNLVASTEYETAIEAFTVIEEAMHYDNIEDIYGNSGDMTRIDFVIRDRVPREFFTSLKCYHVSNY